MAFDNFHQPALGEEGPKFCEECSGQVGTNLEYKISNAIDQMLCSNERTPLYFSVITSTDAFLDGITCIKSMVWAAMCGLTRKYYH